MAAFFMTVNKEILMIFISKEDSKIMNRTNFYPSLFFSKQSNSADFFPVQNKTSKKLLIHCLAKK
ncbi:MAG: hypothetical protein ACTHK8_17100 [Ginsengibacter sp.]|jgi:hypothetical protein